MEQTKTKIKPILFWEGFPACGLLTKQVADMFGDDLVIAATRAAVPFESLEPLLGHKILWLDDANDIWKRKDEFGERNLIIHTGWVHHGWWQYDAYMRNKYGAKVVIMVDNRFRGDFRQYVGALLFRLRMRKYFDAALVPGRSGVRLLRFLGMPKNRIYTGLYGAYEGIYKEITPIENRPLEFLFIGQLIQRKSVDILVKAFQEYKNEGGNWNLRLVGSGPLASLCEGNGISVENFAQPFEVVRKMNQARVLILPSKDDNWGTVVCEAAACGMLLLTSKNVGATYDIVSEGVNGLILPSISTKEIKKALFAFERMDEEAFKKGSTVSKEIAGRFTSREYFAAITTIIRELFI